MIIELLAIISGLAVLKGAINHINGGNDTESIELRNNETRQSSHGGGWSNDDQSDSVASTGNWLDKAWAEGEADYRRIQQGDITRRLDYGQATTDDVKKYAEFADHSGDWRLTNLADKITHHRASDAEVAEYEDKVKDQHLPWYMR